MLNFSTLDPDPGGKMYADPEEKITLQQRNQGTVGALYKF